MAELSLPLLTSLSILMLFISSSTSMRVHQNPEDKSVPLYVLGDSLFDPGNNLYLNSSSSSTSTTANNVNSGCCPYGFTYFKQDVGRWSDGRVVPDFIAEFFGFPVWYPYLQPTLFHDFKKGANFASAGAGVLNETNPDVSISLPEQLGYFKDVVKTLNQEVGEEGTKNIVSEAVYLFSIGGNDYIVFHESHPNSSLAYKTGFVELVTDNLEQVLKEIYKMGGRKFAFQNVGALGCLPGSIVNGKCDEDLNSIAKLHNQRLLEIFENFGTHSPGIKYSIFDYYGAIYDRVIDPSQYGFENGTAACCQGSTERCSSEEDNQVCREPSKYIWFDGAHTTEACNQQLSQLIWDGDLTVVAPINLKQLRELVI